MVEMKLNDMCEWERKKAIFILGEAEKLGMDTSSYGELAVNPNSGYTYLWIEDHNFTLYMPISCELEKKDIIALWTNPEDGEEKEYDLEQNTTLEEIEEWTTKQDKDIEEKEEN